MYNYCMSTVREVDVDSYMATVSEVYSYMSTLSEIYSYIATASEIHIYIYSKAIHVSYICSYFDN
jgi:flagellin-specific chaperone FliS